MSDLKETEIQIPIQFHNIDKWYQLKNEQRIIFNIQHGQITVQQMKPNINIDTDNTIIIRTESFDQNSINRLIVTLARFHSFLLQIPSFPSNTEKDVNDLIFKKEFQFEINNYSSQEDKIPLIQYKEIELNMDKIFQNWINEYQILSPMIILYLTSTLAKNTFYQHKFLGYIQAFETFHRRKYNGKYISDEEHSILKNQLMEIVMKAPKNKPLKKSFKRRLNYIHEYDLRERLDEIGIEKREVIKPFIYEYTAFARDVTNLRNYYTHFDEKRKIKNMTDEYISYLLKCLKILNEICLLSTIQIPNKVIVESLSSRIEYKSLLCKD
jgi:hypothetical protein